MTAVARLEGSKLDEWVARAIGWTLFEMVPGELGYKRFKQSDGTEGLFGTVESGACRFKGFNPSSNWEQGGQLIEKYQLDVVADAPNVWLAFRWNNDGDPVTAVTGHGPRPIIAAMRALVASVYGNSVPDEVPQ